LFKEVVEPPAADYQLSATVIKNTNAVREGQMTVEWQLARSSTGKTLFSEWITSEATTSISEAFIGTRRAALLQERMVRANIKQAIERLGELQL